MKKTILILLLALGCWLLAFTQQTVYVDASNNTGNEDGTEQNPFNTIKEGIAAAEPGDEVYILAGTYLPDSTGFGYEHVVFLKPGIVLKGSGKESTHINGVILDIGENDQPIVLESLRFDAFYFWRGSIEGDFNEISEIRNCSMDVLELAFGPAEMVNDTTPGPNFGFLVENNDLGTDGYITLGQAVGTSPITIQNNKLGTLFISSGGGYTYIIDNNELEFGIIDNSAYNITTISNNTIVNGGIVDRSGGSEYYVEDQLIINNIITSTEYSPFFDEIEQKAAIIAKGSSVSIFNNTINCSGYVSGIRGSSGGPFHVIDNYVQVDEVVVPSPTPEDACVAMYNASAMGNVQGNTFVGGQYGYFSMAATMDFSRNTIRNSHFGFYSYGAEEVHHNTIENCLHDGMTLAGLKGPVFCNTIQNNSGFGIRILAANIDLGGGDYNGQGNNVIKGNSGYGIVVEASDDPYPVIYARYNVWDHTKLTEISEFDIFDGDDQSGLATIVFDPMGSTGMDESEEIDLFEVFPNPTSGKIQITSTKRSEATSASGGFQTNPNFQNPNGAKRRPLKADPKIEIVNLYGKVVKAINLQPATWNLQLDISALPTGIYFVRISSEKQLIVKKIVKY